MVGKEQSGQVIKVPAETTGMLDVSWSSSLFYTDQESYGMFGCLKMLPKGLIWPGKRY